ncbi:MAG TPA: APC family permease [Dongiaceae bacterium]|jgi:amino acid transporter|nr:APC family permease [Dongiaceae bacterium]
MALRRLLIGDPLATAAEKHERLSVLTGLPIFASDALSSVAYATEEILLVLVTGGAALLGYSLPIAVIICLLLAIITISYRQTVHAYPNGGGSYIVAHENFGVLPGLIAAASLLIDYVLTVAVSISAGIFAIISAFPSLREHTVLLCALSVVFMTMANLRGVRESAKVLAFPTWGFIAVMFAMVGWGLYRYLLGDLHPLPVPQNGSHVPKIGDIAFFILMLRAFSSGCTAMTGVEAVSNGVPAFKDPASANAARVLFLLSTILAAIFIGVTFLAYHLNILPNDRESVISQIAHLIFGNGAMYYAVQIMTTIILVLAANTSFAGFPRLASVLAKDGYVPKQLANLGDRLAFSNGILALATLALILLVVFRGNTNALIPLYAIGVFLSFSFSQAGMVVWWARHAKPGWEIKATINGFGAVFTTIALLAIIESKFTEGAWIVIVLIPIFVALFLAVRRHYDSVEMQLSPRMGGLGEWLPWTHNFRPKIVVPVSKMHPGTLAALQLARAISNDVTAVTVDISPRETAELRLAWRAMRLKEKLVVLESPYRAVIEPIMHFLETVDKREEDRGQAVVVLPEFLPAKWWQGLLHNQTALLLKAELLFRKGSQGENRVVIDVPYRLRRLPRLQRA